MGLSFGCTKVADELFAKRYNKEAPTINLIFPSLRSALLTIDGIDTRMDLTYIRGDCTSCTAYLECLQLNEVSKMFTVIQEYMSINGRISCTFSLKKEKSKLKDWIKELQKFPIAGLHVQKSNREPDSSMYMISGILKVPSPIINSYISYDKEYPKEHNNNNVTAINALNAELGLQIF